MHVGRMSVCGWIVAFSDSLEVRTCKQTENFTSQLLFERPSEFTTDFGGVTTNFNDLRPTPGPLLPTSMTLRPTS